MDAPGAANHVIFRSLKCVMSGTANAIPHGFDDVDAMDKNAIEGRITAAMIKHQYDKPGLGGMGHPGHRRGGDRGAVAMDSGSIPLLLTKMGSETRGLE